MKQRENIVAVMPEPEIMDEQQLSQQITDIEFRAESFIIQSEEDYADAGAFGKLLKQKASEVEAFFKPMKDSAYQAHKSICSREKSMLAPLKSAEKTIKKAMSAFLMEQEAKRNAAEEKARQAAKAEMQCKLAEAEKLEIAGNLQGAQAAMEEAVVMDEASHYIASPATKPKVSGVGTSKGWEITSIDSNAVPVNFSGMELRPVDEAAVMRLIRASKGQIQIPGITYHEVTKMSFRR